MKAIFLEGQPPGGARTRLEDNLPLSTPYVLQIFPAYACNFTCKYCHFSIEKSKRGFASDCVYMDMDVYRKCIDDIAGFPEKVKTLRFVGMGEPLLHKNIDQMIAYARARNVANRLELLTNGSLLTHDMSDRLLAAGLDRLVVSLQGTSAAKYREVSSVELDFRRFVEQIRYFYDHKKITHMYLKIVDIALDGDDDRRRYFDMFGDICDTIGIETAVPLYPDVQYNAALSGQDSKTQFGTKAIKTSICSQPFFTLQINPDAKVVGCHSVTYPEIFGEANRENVVDIWNGERYNSFRRRMLNGKDSVCDLCRTCEINLFRMQKDDMILDARGILRDVYHLG